MSVRDVIKIIDFTFQGIDIAACISICDSDGLVLYNVGECADQWLLEAISAYLIMAFESTMEKLKSFNEVLDSLIINSGDFVFYIDDLRGKENLFIIIKTSTERMQKVLPFLKNAVGSIERSLMDLG
ncbi:hypothetical protein [Candidatus Hodarchaeum mangrovi]